MRGVATCLACACVICACVICACVICARPLRLRHLCAASAVSVRADGTIKWWCGNLVSRVVVMCDALCVVIMCVAGDGHHVLAQQGAEGQGRRSLSFANALARLTPACGPHPASPRDRAAAITRRALSRRVTQTANALARLTPVSGPRHHAPGRSRALRDCHAERVSAGAYGSGAHSPPRAEICVRVTRDTRK